MHTLRLCIVVVAFSVSCLLGQEQSPGTVSVISGESSKLMPGDNFEFQLRFEQTPEGYGDGAVISCEFRAVAVSGRTLEDQASVPCGAPLKDGQARYSLSVPITKSMDKGKWQLSSVKVGKAAPKDVNITGNVAIFEIPLPPPILHVDYPEKVVAGTSFLVRVRVDAIPDDIPRVPPECDLILSFGMRAAAPVNVVPRDNVPVRQDQHLYVLKGKLDVDVPSGAWKGLVALDSDRSAQGREMERKCHYDLPPYLGQFEFNVTVLPSPGLVIPTAVSAIVNPSQIDLLHTEARRLRDKAEHLEEQLALGSKTGDRGLLRDTLLEANADLDRTEAIFKQKGVEQPSVRDVDTFFDDIRLDYREVLKVLRNRAARERDGQLLRVGSSAARSSPSAAGSSAAVLHSIRRNANAYDVVASTHDFAFTLDVYSEPKGATISYRRRGDEYHPADHETDWRIEHLVRAVWQIRLQKPGYEDSEEFFDAVNSSATSITIELKRK